MWRKNAARFLILTLMSVLLTPNCATLLRKRTQRIPVTSAPAGATVIVNGFEQGVTPLVIRLARKQRGQVIRIESPGYNPFEIRMKRRVSSISSVDVICGGLLGLYMAGIYCLAHDETADETTVILTMIPATIGSFILIDKATGAGYDLDPYNLTVTLTKADGTPRVDTLLDDADDFRNVKWIRVHRD